MRRTPGRRCRPLTQAQITRAIATSELTGSARQFGPYPPGAPLGPRTAAHRHADQDLTPVETRQRRRQREREAARAPR